MLIGLAPRSNSHHANGQRGSSIDRLIVLLALDRWMYAQVDAWRVCEVRAAKHLSCVFAHSPIQYIDVIWPMDPMTLDHLRPRCSMPTKRVKQVPSTLTMP